MSCNESRPLVTIGSGQNVIYHLDVSFQPSSISLTICGVFRETRENCSTGHALAFTRTFFLMATGSGYNITNDMLSITHATEQLLEVSII